MNIDVKKQHIKGIRNLADAFVQDIIDFDDIHVNKRGYEINYRDDDGVTKKYHIVMYIEEV